jgi:hypothetical protein
VGSAIAGAVRLLTGRRDLAIHMWEENDISGRALTDPIFEQIATSGVLIADITTMNFNVTFEIGYAIGRGRRVHLVRNANFKNDRDLTGKIGIFDTLGFETYANEQELVAILTKVSSEHAIPIRTTLSRTAPIYLLQTPVSAQAMLAIIGRIKKSRLGFKSFIPPWRHVCRF